MKHVNRGSFMGSRRKEAFTVHLMLRATEVIGVVVSTNLGDNGDGSSHGQDYMDILALR